MPNATNTGDGSRPTTDGGVDNIGAGKAFNPAEPENGGPAKERGPLRKADAAQTRSDDSAPLGMRDSGSSTPNPEPPKTAIDNNARR